MKKIYLILPVLLILFLTSCTSAKDIETTVKDSATKASYQTTEEKYTNKDISISYPQISGLNGSTAQNSINQLIKTEALKGLNFFAVTDSLTLEISYKIKSETAGILSVVYTGTGYVQGTAYPTNLFYTTNIDIKNGVKLQLKDIVKADNDLADKYLSGAFIPLDASLNSAQTSMTKEEFSQALLNADSLEKTNIEKQFFTFSYLTEDSLGISVNVIHALGDHQEYEIKLADIENNLLPVVSDIISN